MIESDRFHHRDKGCLTVRARKEVTYDQHYLYIYKCLTHDRECCRCGWEFGWHGGRNNNPENKKVDNIKEVINYYE